MDRNRKLSLQVTQRGNFEAILEGQVIGLCVCRSDNTWFFHKSLSGPNKILCAQYQEQIGLIIRSLNRIDLELSDLDI